jgi:amidase
MSPFSNDSANAKFARKALVVALISAMTACGSSNKSSSKTEEAEAPFSVMEITISSLHEALESGDVTCREVVQTYLDRIEAYDKTTGLNAIIRTNTEALELADELDERIAAGEQLGDMYCVPVIVKDNYDTYDMPTSGGNLALAYSIPPDDSYVVKALRDADAIMLAKSNLDEFAFKAAHTVSSVGGITRNAYHLGRTPAGSSGGTATAVAANFGTIGLGSDTGNSIRGPSSHASLVGLRSTMGLVSRDGVIPLNLDRDVVGGMTRTVEDTARVLNVIAGYDPADPITELSEGNVHPDYLEALQKDGLKGARIGVFRQMIDDTADPDVLEKFEQAIADLKAQGATIVDPIVVENYQTLLNGATSCNRFHYDLDNYLESLGPDRPVKDLEQIIESGLFSAAHASNLKNNVKVTLAPYEMEKPCLGEAGDIANNPGRQAFRDAIVGAMKSAKVDAMIYPTWDNAAQPLNNLSDLPTNKGDNSQGLAPASGQPAITVPMGFDRDGLPLGLQIFGYPFDEFNLIKFAYAYEQATHHRKPPALFPELKK